MIKGKVNDYIKRISDESIYLVLESLGRNDITVAQLTVLAAIDVSDKGTFTVTDAQKALHVSQPTATGIVKRLDRNGFVKCSSYKDDARVKLIKLTRKGEKCLEDLGNAVAIADKKLLDCLDSEEQKEFKRLLKKIYGSYCD